MICLYMLRGHAQRADSPFVYDLGWFNLPPLLFSCPCEVILGVLVSSHGHEYVCPSTCLMLAPIYFGPVVAQLLMYPLYVYIGEQLWRWPAQVDRLLRLMKLDRELCFVISMPRFCYMCSYDILSGLSWPIGNMTM